MKTKTNKERNDDKIVAPECECSIMTMTKDVVDNLISNNVRNRKIVKSNLKKLIDEFSSGRYCFTGQPIIIDSNNRLLDGKHRLYALRGAGYPPIRSIVVKLNGDSTEIDNAYDKMDTGVTRRFGVKLLAMGVKNGKKVAAICNKISYIETGYTRWPVNPDSYLMDILNLYNTSIGNEKCEENNFVYRMANLMKTGSGFVADMAAACCVVARVTGCYDEIENLIKMAIDGSMLSRGSAAHTLNKMFSGVIKREQKGRGYNSSCFAMTVNAIVAHLNNEKYPLPDRNIKRAMKWIEMMAKDNGVFLLPHTINKTSLKV